MSEEIGKKIKSLRKELNMTQSQLAEPEMTKSMLSHIENGNANPSMKTLQYLASKLNKHIAYFLEDDTYEDTEKLPINQILKALEEVDCYIKDNKAEIAKEKIEEMLKEFDFKNDSKIYADIICRLGKCFILVKDYESAEKYLKLCSDIYAKNLLYIDAAKAYFLLTKKYMYLYDYKKCFEVIERANKLYKNSTSRDIFFEIEILVEMPAVTLAQGDFEKTIEVCSKAIKLSHESNIYYLTDKSYRMLANTYLLQGELDKFLINMKKAEEYVQFTSNKYVLARINQNLAMYYNTVNEPKEALKHLKIYENNTDERAFYFFIEIARAKYLLGEYEEALKALDKINFNEKIYYLIDCIYLVTAKVLKGLILFKVNDNKNAIAYISQAIEEIEPYTLLEYKGFVNYARKEMSIAFKCISDIYYTEKNYEQAYLNLTKSLELSKSI